jgi:hypothetical protein
MKTNTFPIKQANNFAPGKLSSLFIFILFLTFSKSGFCQIPDYFGDTATSIGFVPNSGR